MAVGASKPAVIADKDGFFSVKSKMLVGVGFYHLLFNFIYRNDRNFFCSFFLYLINNK